jgi:hypothetical protein
MDLTSEWKGAGHSISEVSLQRGYTVSDRSGVMEFGFFKRRLDGWHVHHLLWHSHGGVDDIDNLVLLYHNCHRQVYSEGLVLTHALPGARSRIGGALARVPV